MAPENFDDPVYIVNREFFFTTVDQTTRKYSFQAFTCFHLAHYKCPERHFHNEILGIDRYTITHVSAILIIPVTLAPLTGFHASKRRDISRVSIPFRALSASSSPAQCSRCSVFPLLSAQCRFISNHPIQI